MGFFRGLKFLRFGRIHFFGRTIHHHETADASSHDSIRSNTPSSVPPEVIFQPENSNRPEAPPPDHDNNPSPHPASHIDSLTWDDIQTDAQGKPYGFLGVPFLALTSKQLRIVCSRLEIKGVKNVRKEIIKALQYY